MIKILKNCLMENPNITDWIIRSIDKESVEAFYVLQKKELTRKTSTFDYSVTIYKKFTEDNVDYLGSSTFNVGRVMKKAEVNKLIEDALYACSFVKNKFYDIVNPEEIKQGPLGAMITKKTEIIDETANIFFSKSIDNIRFNALEIFLETENVNVVNSRGIDYKKRVNYLKVEAIPSYDEKENQVELYKFYTYNTFDKKQIEKDATQALEDVKSRYNATKLEYKGKLNVLLRNNEIKETISEVIGDFSYRSVYTHSNKNNINDMLQKEDCEDLLNISLEPISEKQFFDGDGVILKKAEIVKEGKVLSLFGDNQNAQYLNVKPTGSLPVIHVTEGKFTTKQLKKSPYIEIIALSGIQVDIYNDYIGGEVRLANYFNGKTIIPVSGFSFSGSLQACLDNLKLSSKKVDINNYKGPELMLLANMEVL